MHVRIGEVMVQRGLLTAAQVEQILELQRRRARPFGELAERLFQVSAEDVEAAWVEQYAAITEHVDPTTEALEPEVMAMVTRRQAWQFRLLPMRRDGAEVMVATTDKHLTRAMRFALRHIATPCWFVLAEPAKLGEALAAHYPMQGLGAEAVSSDEPIFKSA